MVWLDTRALRAQYTSEITKHHTKKNIVCIL
jgi:hypothetical protein